MSDLAKIADVDIDSTGVFKYILVKVTSKNSDSKLIVRGYSRCDYHADILKETKASIGKGNDFSLKCLGGGRINHDPMEKTLSVYGYSQGFGRADHQKTVDLLRRSFPDYKTINWSNDGY